jgi:hypothetical protein
VLLKTNGPAIGMTSTDIGLLKLALKSFRTRFNLDVEQNTAISHETVRCFFSINKGQNLEI